MKALAPREEKAGSGGRQETRGPWRRAQLADVVEFLDYRRRPVNEAERRRRIANKQKEDLFPYYGANGQVGWIDEYIFDEPLILLAEDGGNFGSRSKPVAYAVSGKYWVNNHAHCLRPKPGLSFDFLRHALSIRPDIGELVTGSTRGKLNQETAAKIEIPLPPLAEQERIAGRLTAQLGAAERARAAAVQRLAGAEALPAALLREVFEGPETSGWVAVRLGTLLRRHNEIIHPGDRKSGEAVFVGLEHIESHTGRRIGSGRVAFASMTGRKPTFKRGQIVYGYLRPYLNKVWIADFDGCSSVDQFAFDVNPELADTVFVAAFMRSATFLRRAQGVTTTGQLPRISIEEIAAVDIELPPDLPTQRRLAAELTERLAVAEGVIARCREELAAIDALPAALLREAFGGSEGSPANSEAME